MTTVKKEKKKHLSKSDFPNVNHTVPDATRTVSQQCVAGLANLRENGLSTPTCARGISSLRDEISLVMNKQKVRNKSNAEMQ